MESLEKEMYDKMVLQEELQDKARLAAQERVNKAKAEEPKQKEPEPKQVERPQTSAADQAKKQKLQVKFDRIKDKVQLNKDSAV